MTAPLHIASLVSSDLPVVAEIHCAAFRRSVLTRLGTEAVRRYYHWQLTGPHDVVALLGSTPAGPAGFVVAGFFRGAMSGFLGRNKWYLAWRLLACPWLLGDGMVRGRLARAQRLLCRPQKAPSPAEPAVAAAKRTGFDVLAIAVHPTFQGQSVAFRLMLAVEDSARNKGCTEMHLTVATENLRAIQFYGRLGWEKTAKHGIWSGSMKKVI